MDTLTENLIKLGMAVLIGGILGAEREFRDKAAGFRTLILITVGSTLFTIFSLTMDPGFTQTRIAANIVTGIGFLGAGAIIREHGRVGGLTTAATIWLSAALGMGIGAGELTFVIASTLAVTIVLLIFPRLELWIDHIRESRSYRIVVSTSNVEKVDKIHEAFETCELQVFEHHQSKIGTTIVGTWHTIGAPKNHEKFVNTLLKDKDIEEFVY
ncbi:MAG TPA: MgtC/SapB family protein [Anaerolineales bacterium]|nr:MgtC/SapB family protein [Anaerolineales bacterium]